MLNAMKTPFRGAPYRKMQEVASHDYAKQQHFAHQLQPSQQQ